MPVPNLVQYSAVFPFENLVLQVVTLASTTWVDRRSNSAVARLSKVALVDCLYAIFFLVAYFFDYSSVKSSFSSLN